MNRFSSHQVGTGIATLGITFAGWLSPSPSMGIGVTSTMQTTCSSHCPILISENPPQNYDLAADYSSQHGGDALLVMQGDRITFENYQNDYTKTSPHTLATATQSFVGVMALTAIEDGLLELDERVADTIPEWKSDSLKAKITVRQLLTLTSGLDAGKRGQSLTYAKAIEREVTHKPGDRFLYGPAPFQVFGEIMQRKLAQQNESPLDYLKRRIFNPIGLKVKGWEQESDGNPNLSSGASLSARDWAKFGLLIKNKGEWQGWQLLSQQRLKQSFRGSKVNPAYGLTFWLNATGEDPGGEIRNIVEGSPSDLVMAAGTKGQRLYIIPSLDMVVVRFGRSSSFKDQEFLALLFNKTQLQ